MKQSEKITRNHTSFSALRVNPVYFCSPKEAAILLSEKRKLILFARHGLTDWNMEMRLQGREDIPLNIAGKNQAMELANCFEKATLRGLDINNIYTSPLCRAIDTAAYISEKVLNAPPVITYNLIERDYSSLSGLTLKRRRQLYPRPKDYPADMESVPMTAERIKKVALALYEENKEQVAVAVTHGGVMNALFSYITCGRVGSGKNISYNCTIAAVAAGKADVIPLAFNLHSELFVEYITQIYNL